MKLEKEIQTTTPFILSDLMIRILMILERLTVQKELSAINNDLRQMIRYPGSQHYNLIHKFYDKLYCLYLTAAHIQFQESEVRDSNLTEEHIFDKINHRTQNNTLRALLNLTSQKAMTTARQMIFKADSQELEIEIEEARKIVAYADQQYKIKNPKNCQLVCLRNHTLSQA